MRICIASGTFHPEVGGPPTYLAGLADDLITRGHRVRVVTYGHSTATYRYAIRRIPRDLTSPLRLALFGSVILNDARSADLLFVNDYGLPAATANLLLRKPLVMKIVGDFAWEYALRHRLVPRSLGIDEFQHRSFDRAVEGLRQLQAWYARKADLVITPSHYLASIVTAWGVPTERVRVVRNAPSPLTSKGTTGRVQQALDSRSEADFAVATVARLAPWKGIDVLIQAMTAARETAPRLRLFVIGEGEERARLERLAAPLDGAVRFVGQVERGEALEAIARADAVALCSSYEGLSHVLLEAMSAGKPIIATAVGGNPELIRDGENGLLVPFGDVEALAAALSRLATQPELARRLAARALRDADHYPWSQLVDTTLGVFQEAVALHKAVSR